MRKEVLWGSELSAGGKLWDPLSHPRSGYRWWNASGSRKACGPCGSCYPRALVQASGVRRQPQPPGKWDVMPPQVDLHMPVPGSHASRGKRGCPNTAWTPGNLFRRVLPLLCISSLTGKKTLHRKVSLCITQVSKSAEIWPFHSVNIEVLLLVLVSSLSSVFLLKWSDPVLPGERKRNSPHDWHYKNTIKRHCLFLWRFLI